MNPEEIVQAWKDPDYRGDARHPAGEIVMETSGGNDLMLNTWTQCTVTHRALCTHAPDCYLPLNVG